MSPKLFDLHLKRAQESVRSTPIWCNWKGEPASCAGPLPSARMVASGKFHASPDLLRFRDPSFFIPGSIHHSLPMWSEILQDSPDRSAFLRYLEFGVDVKEFFTEFKGSFQGRVYSSPLPPRALFPNNRSCQAFSEFISNTILERVANGSLSVWGKVGEVSPPHLVMPITVEPSKPRMCHDERFLDLWIKDLPFSLDLITDLPQYVHKGNFQTTCDDKSGYDHIRLSTESRTYFGLEWSGWYFVFNTLPFGWKASAYLYHSVGLVATSYICSHGVPCSQYIDDRHFGQLQIRRNAPPCSWSDFQRAQAALYIACYILIDLGYFIGLKKSTLVPTQAPIFLGYIIDSVKTAFLMPPDKKIKFASLREDLLSHKTVSLKSLQKFVGKINSFTLVVPAARLFSRVACLAMSRASKSPRAIPVSRELKAEFEHWRFLDSWSGFLPWKDEKHFQLDVFSDASDSGWGGILRLPDQPRQELHGHWDLSESDLPIVVKEALALLYVLRKVAGFISNARIDCFVDSATLVACWRKDGSRNTRVNNALKEIFHLTLSANLQVILHFVPSQQNPADSPSRIPSDRDCTLSPASWLIVQQAFGPHTIDLMATSANVQKDSTGRALPFFAPSPSPQALGVNVFSQTLSPSLSAYAFPPFVLVGPLIRFLTSQSCPYTIVVPDLRPRKYWWPLLVSSCVDSFKLGSKGDHNMLLFPTNTGVESRPLQWDLWVFRICPV